MNAIRHIRTALEDDWNVLCNQDWKCQAQKRFARVWYAPMLAEIDLLASASNELQELCQESIAAAKSVREPDENQDWRNETWQND